MRTVRRGIGSVVTWRRTQIMLPPAQSVDVAGIAKVAFTREDHVRDVPTTSTPTGSTPPTCAPAAGSRRSSRCCGVGTSRRRQVQAGRARPAVLTWSLSKPADFLVADEVVDDISHEILRILLREEGTTFPRLKTQKGSTDAEFKQRKPETGICTRSPTGKSNRVTASSMS